MNWTREEIILIVSDYMKMLKAELAGIPYNKSEHRKKLAPRLHNRDKAIEFKHRNISGALADMGYPYIKGYKPLFNYQELLAEEVAIQINNDKLFYTKKFKDFANEEPAKIKKMDFEKVVDNSPVKTKSSEKEISFQPIKINFLEREQNNKSLGDNGERFVYDYEKWRLIKAGKEKLADKVEWVAQEKGDGMGFDILSKTVSGKDMFIEVKTTKLAKETPIYFSRREWRFAQINAKDFYLYRVFNFIESPLLFIMQGEYESFCKLQTQSFKGYF
jgi:hypothetical protein